MCSGAYTQYININIKVTHMQWIMPNVVKVKNSGHYINVGFFWIVFSKKERKTFLSHGFSKQGVVSSSSYTFSMQYKKFWLWRMCILCWFKLLNKWYFLKTLDFKKQIIFLENTIYKNEGTKLFLLTISYTTYKIVSKFYFFKK